MIDVCWGVGSSRAGGTRASKPQCTPSVRKLALRDDTTVSRSMAEFVMDLFAAAKASRRIQVVDRPKVT